MYSTPWMSDIVVGTMRWGASGADFSTAQYEQMIEASLEMGFTTFDHADIYGDHTTEADFGAALKLHSNWREQMEIVTKCGILSVGDNKPEYKHKAYDSSLQHILKSVDDSLIALNTDYIDVLLLHRPDLLMDVDEVGEAFELLHRSGKVTSFGVSNFSASQVSMLQKKVPIGCHQMEISMRRLDAFNDGTLDQCISDGLVPMAWSPLGGGSLPKSVDVVLQELSKEFYTTPHVIALSWLMKHPAGILPIIGTTNKDHLITAKGALSIALNREQWYQVYQAATGTILP